jgi:hypothetical protein
MYSSGRYYLNKQAIQMKKLNTRGFSHHIILVAFVLVFAVAGVAYLVASHASSKKCIYNTFNVGSSGHCVGDIQNIIKNNGKNNQRIAVDGSYGADTQRAVANYQKSRHLKADGVVGRTTWKYLCGTANSVGAYIPPVYDSGYDAGCFKK